MTETACRLKHAILISGSVQQLSSQIGVKPRAIYDWLNNRNSPTKANSAKIQAYVELHSVRTKIPEYSRDNELAGSQSLTAAMYGCQRECL